MVASASADIIVFDDAFQNGWKAAQWDMTTNATAGIGGSATLTSLKSGGGSTGIRISTADSAGQMVGANSLLEFWFNTSDGSVSPGITVGIKYNANSTTYMFDQKGVTRTYNIDGVDTLYVVGGSIPADLNIRTDADGSTWQKVTVDLTEVVNTGWPYVANQWDPATQVLNEVSIGFDYRDTSDKLLVDNVKLVPEPATMSVLGLGALALLRRRRR
jgi:hypothetical protein